MSTIEIYQDDYLVHISFHALTVSPFVCGVLNEGHVVMEYMSGGDLYERISRKGHYTGTSSPLLLIL